MPTQADLDAADTYCNLMKEVRWRVESISTLLNTPIGLHPQLMREFCFIQLRKICEITGLACLVAHGDITASFGKDLQKAHEPGRVLGALERVHADFFPVPIVPVAVPGGVFLETYTKPYMTKPELIALWGRCGDILHRGSFKTLMKGAVQVSTDFSDVTLPGQKILNLLSHHRISRLGGNLHFIAVLDDGGDTKVWIAESAADDESIKD
jgi:hypothetical protein